MQTPDTLAGELTEGIMAKIRIHLQPDEPHSSTHYNRTYEVVLETLSNPEIILLRAK